MNLTLVSMRSNVTYKLKKALVLLELGLVRVLVGEVVCFWVCFFIKYRALRKL